MSMDGKTTVINPLAVGEFEPAGEVEVHKGPKVLPDKDLAEYAEATGQSVLKLKEHARSAVLGELAQRLGTDRLGNAMLLNSPDMILEGIRQIDKMIDDYAHEPKVIGSLVKARLGLIEQYGRIAHTLIKSKRDSGPEVPIEKPQNEPPPPLMPVQINIHGNSVSSNTPVS